MDRRTMLKMSAGALLGSVSVGNFALSSIYRVEDFDNLETDVCIVGGGSGGIGAAISVARNGFDVILVDEGGKLGGTSTRALVCNWEPGPGDSISAEIYRRLKKMPNAVGISADHNADRKQGPFGLWLIDPELTYEQSLRRSGLDHSQWHGVVFSPDAFHDVVSEILNETGKCHRLMKTKFAGAEKDGNRVFKIKAVGEDGISYNIRARIFVDCTGGGSLCRSLGCSTMLGIDSKSKFNEPSAPDESHKSLNAISLCYKIKKSEHPVSQKQPDPRVAGWVKSAHVTGDPSGGLIVNPLAMLPGIELINMGYEKAMDECRRRAEAHWHWLQSIPAFSGYELDHLAEFLGMRESYRVIGEYVLTQHDLMAGLERQEHADIVAIADHAMDIHGAGGICKELSEPYGIPYGCLIPKGWNNLLVACRGASFSHIAASSCRLSRTIMSLGHGAGIAAVMALENNVSVDKIDVFELKDRIRLTDS